MSTQLVAYSTPSTDPEFSHPDCTCAARTKPHEAYCPLSKPVWMRRAAADDLPTFDRHNGAMAYEARQSDANPFDVYPDF